MTTQYINGFTMISNKFISRINKITPKAVCVYLALVRRINQQSGTTEVWPSFTTIMEDTGLCRDAVNNSVKELLAIGYINHKQKGFNSVNHYFLGEVEDDNEFDELVRKYIKVLKEVVVKTDLSSSPNRLEVVVKTDSNNTNITTLKNNKHSTEENSFTSFHFDKDNKLVLEKEPEFIPVNPLIDKLMSNEETLEYLKKFKH